MSYPAANENSSRRKLAKSLRFRILARDKFTCRYCGLSTDSSKLHVDHIHPVSKGGADNDTNLVTACADCNMGKRDQHGILPPPSNDHRPTSDKSVVGWFGYRLNDKGRHLNQFVIKHQMDGDRYAIQLFSYLDGGPTKIEVISGSELFGPAFELYDSERAWTYAAAVDGYRADRERGGEGIPSIEERFENQLWFKAKLYGRKI